MNCFEEQEVERMVSQYSAMLLRLASTRLGGAAEAEDAVQEAFLQLLRRQAPFRDREHEKAWLIRATLSRASDIRRQKDRQALPLDQAAPLAAPQPEQPDGELLAAVQALPEKYSAAIHLYYYEGYSIKEIAKLLGAPAATVGARLARGRARLRQMLKED